MIVFTATPPRTAPFRPRLKFWRTTPLFNYISETRGSGRNGRSRSMVLVGPASPHKRPAAFARRGPPHSGMSRAEQETEEKKPVCDEIGDQVKQRLQ